MTWNSKENEYYIRLGTFLQFLQNVIMLNQKTTTATEFAPSLRFDFDMYSNLMYVNPNQVSVDPRICMVNRSLDKLPAQFAVGGNGFIEDKLKKSIPNVDYGRIMNIYVNFVFILEKIDELKSEQGTVVLIDFLQGILNGITKALSGINELDVFIEETTTTVKIIDKNPLPNKEKVLEYIKSADFEFSSTNSTKPTLIYEQNYTDISTADTVFQLFGYNNSSAGFIKDFTFKTELTPAFSTMITVGASARGEVVGANETALSRINKGLVDRYKVEMKNGNSPTTPTAIEPTVNTIERLNKNYSLTLEQYSTFLIQLSTTQQSYNKETIDNYQPVLSNLISTENQIEKLKNPTTSSIAIGTGFIPFNLSLTMDGLSGMKINEKFTVDTDFLPSNYPGNVEFLIKNLSHEVANNKWLTKIDSYCIASGNFEGQKSFLVEGDAEGGGSGRGSGGGSRKDRTEIRQLVIHYTVGEGSAQQTVATVASHGPGFGIHYAVEASGVVARGDGGNDLKYLSHGNNLNKWSVGVELTTFGHLFKKKGTNVFTTEYGSKFKNTKNRDIVNLGYTYNNDDYFADYTDNQMLRLKAIILTLFSKYPKIKEAIKGKNVYTEVFGIPSPAAGGKYTSSKVNDINSYGIYSHSRAPGGTHVDSFPSPKLVAMLLSLGFSGTVFPAKETLKNIQV
jgi:hypothetical protein